MSAEIFKLLRLEPFKVTLTVLKKINFYKQYMEF